MDSITKISLFMANYKKKLRIKADIRREKSRKGDRVCKKRYKRKPE